MADENSNGYDNLRAEFLDFIKKLENKDFFYNLFILKYLPYKIRAVTDINLKVSINLLFYEFNDNIEENDKKEILKAYFKIIILHEIAYLLKYCKKNSNYDNIPSTPNNKEGGKMFINYLFGLPTINEINLEQAKKINNLNNWENVKELRKIFNKKISESEKPGDINKEKKYVKFYLSEKDESFDDFGRTDPNEIGIDIN